MLQSCWSSFGLKFCSYHTAYTCINFWEHWLMGLVFKHFVKHFQKIFKSLHLGVVGMIASKWCYLSMIIVANKKKKLIEILSRFTNHVSMTIHFYKSNYLGYTYARGNTFEKHFNIRPCGPRSDPRTREIF